jgi:phosphoribosylformimino-5-aminoimidazole carboxamide ribotide isomerase
MSTFTVFPAIDLRAGRVVRLVQGDPARQTVFGDDPAAMARRWIDAGASWLHVVNLDGAFEEQDNQNRTALGRILQALEPIDPPPFVQLGGGLRTLADIENSLSMGVSRVILGTVVVSAPGILVAALERFGPEKVVAALDVADGKVRLRGWMHESELDPVTLGKRLSGLGVGEIIYTDVTRDGTGAGLNLAAAATLAQATGLSIVVSGGVRSLDDVRQVRLSGLSGVIIGRALYDGAITLQEALAC